MLDNSQQTIIKEAHEEAKEFQSDLKDLETKWQGKLKATKDKLFEIVTNLGEQIEKASDAGDDKQAGELDSAKDDIEEIADTIKEMIDKIEDHEIIDNVVEMLEEATKLS